MPRIKKDTVGSIETTSLESEMIANRIETRFSELNMVSLKSQINDWSC